MSERLDLLLIHPGAAHGIYGKLGDDLVAVEPPLWCRLIAGYVRNHGHSVKIIDAEAMQLSPAQVATMVVALEPRLTCLAVYGHQPSASTQQMHGAGLTAKAIKNLCTNLPVMMLGGHVSALPEKTIREEAIDYACVGEGPITVEALLRGMKEGVFVREAVPGLVWRGRATAAHINERAPLIEDLKRLNGDTWDLLPMERYRAHNWQCFDDLTKRQPYAAIYTTLGCPFRCSFCCINAPFATNRYRMRESRDVVDEILKLKERYGVRTFKIVDEMFVLKDKYYTAICEGLIASGEAHDINIWAYARVDTVETGKLEMLRKAGFRWLALGIESGSKHVRDGAKKAMREDDIAGVVRAIQGADINVIANYIFGLPDDDMASMQDTLDLALELNTEFANFYSAMAYPGSPLYAEAVAQGWTLPETWRGYSQHNDDCRPLDTKHVSGAEVLRFRDEAFTAYFTNPAYLDMVGRKFGLMAVDHVCQMTKYRLPRKLLTAA